MRRSGRTTRQVDEAIQTLFTTGKVVWKDHAAARGNMAQTSGWKILMGRLQCEHNLSRDDLVIDLNPWTIKLKQ